MMRLSPTLALVHNLNMSLPVSLPKLPASDRLALQAAFEAWCQYQRQNGRLRRVASVAVYQSMWQALAAWCAMQAPPLRLQDLHAPALAAYLASRSGLLLADGLLTPRYQRRLLSLVQRVQAHRAWLRLSAGPGPVAALAQPPLTFSRPPTGPLHDGLNGITPAEPLEPLLHLTPAEHQQLRLLLCNAPELATGGRWQLQRDHCAAALQLGAGLGPGELRALRLGDVLAPPPTASTSSAARPWQLKLAASGSAAAHVVPLAPWAAKLLAGWLQLRQDQALGGDWLFPATRSGKPWGKVAQYEAAKRVLTEAGLGQRGGGSFLLRHSFALHQLQQGVDETLLSRWLGVVDAGVMARYRAVLAAWPAAVPASSAAAPLLPV